MQDALNKIVLLGLVWSPRFLNIIKIKECCFSPSNASSFLFPAKVADQNLDLFGTEQVLVLEGFFLVLWWVIVQKDASVFLYC